MRTPRMPPLSVGAAPAVWLLLVSWCLLVEHVEALKVSSSYVTRPKLFTGSKARLFSRRCAVSAPGRSSSSRLCATTVDTPSTTSSSSSSLPSFDNFSYLEQWYPVVWARDVIPNKPHKVTLFDTDYVLCLQKNQNDNKEGDAREVTALVDVCPHKAAALSEGRITALGEFQCAYHGWTFDGESGRCTSIPQVERFAASTATNTKKSRADARAVPAMIVQGMVWLFPGGGLEKALLAPPPPRVPEMDQEGFRVLEQIRDFPVDWSVLLENIMDPDHGLFAHQMQPFDLYTASTTSPQTITESLTHNDQRWTITSRVDAIDKLSKRDQALRTTLGLLKPKKEKTSKKKKNQKKQQEDEPNVSTTTYTAPSLIYMGRRHPHHQNTTYLTAFWITPTGTGKSRFMSAVVMKAPQWIPLWRWMNHVFLNNFVDQDTYLLATQQVRVLEREAELLLQHQAKHGFETIKEEEVVVNLPVRKSLYAYRSPTEKLGVRLGSFLDQTLSRAPKRAKKLRQPNAVSSVLPVMDRRVVLDRFSQHTKICPESMRFVQNCRLVKKLAVGVVGVVHFLRFVTSTAGGMMVTSAAAAAAASTGVAAKVWSILHPILPHVSRRAAVLWSLGSGVVYWLAEKMQREFYFKYEDRLRERDMENIPKKVWLDEHVGAGAGNV